MVPGASACSSPWILNGNACYLFQQSLPSNWFDARLSCIREGGDLLSIEDQSEQDFISRRRNGSYWIGLSDTQVEGVFVWTDGTNYDTSQFKNWDNLEPNGHREENCVVLGSHWKDCPCSTLFLYICERKIGGSICSCFSGV